MLWLLAWVVADAAYPFATTTVFPLKNKTLGLLPNEEIVYIDLLHRHGSRYPTTKSLNRIRDAYDYLNTGNVHFENPWKAVAKGGILCSRGFDELRSLGRFYAKEFANRSPIRSLDDLRLEATFKARTQQSMQAFLEGFFPGDTASFARVQSHNYTATIHNATSRTLFFHGACKRFHAHCKDPATQVERERFRASQFPQRVMLFKERTGLSTDFPINTSTIELIFAGAKFEYVVFGTKRGMLSFFNRSDMEVFAYAKDLETSVVKGHTNPLNYQIATPLLRDIAARIKGAATGAPASPRGTFRFAHEETVLPLMARMGFFKDGLELRADTPASKWMRREWNTSRIGPFASHVLFALVRASDELYVRLFYNQQPVAIPFCAGRLRCPVDEFLARVDDLTRGCDFDAACALP